MAKSRVVLPRLWWSLLRCPICRVRGSGPSGCCQACEQGLFHPRVDAYMLVLGSYQGKLAEAIKALKFQHASRLARLFGRALAREVARQGWRVDVVCPVPLHFSRRWQRGYNQSMLIASALAQALERPCRQCLSRPRRTRQQARLPGHARHANVESAFRARRLDGEQVLLVDDVITSGATIAESSLTLLSAGASRVFVAAVAQAAHDQGHSKRGAKKQDEL
jgi:ComF family protein